MRVGRTKGSEANCFVSRCLQNTAAVNSCLASMSATPTTKVTVTRRSTNVRYWTVTVTGVAAEVTLQPSDTKSAAGSYDWSIWTLSVVGFAMMLAV